MTLQEAENAAALNKGESLGFGKLRQLMKHLPGLKQCN